MTQDPNPSLSRAIRLRLSESAPLDSLAQELARVQTGLDALVSEVRSLKAQRQLRDLLLPQAQVLYKGLSVAQIDAGVPLEPRHGFYGIEYDAIGKPYRWTGPGADFHFDLHLDRSAPLRFSLAIGVGLGLSCDELRAFCDGIEIPLVARELGTVVEFSAVLLPREALGLTRLVFQAVETFQPEGDTRHLGVAFRELTLMPTSTEDAQQYLAGCDDLARAALTGTPPAASAAAETAAPAQAATPAKPAPAKAHHKRGGRR